MGFFRQYIAPLFIVLIFAIALLATSARIFLPSDMMAPAPGSQPISAQPVSQMPFPAPSMTTASKTVVS